MSLDLLRFAPLMGQDGLNRLKQSHVALFGLGGVGGHAAEALVRSGVGTLTIVDGDSFEASNLNRQLFALHSTLGRRKTDVATERLRDINPDMQIVCHDTFVDSNNIDTFDFTAFDFVIDAIDTVTTKLLIIERCKATATAHICCLGTGRKLDATQLTFADISGTSGCALARVMRRELKARGIKDVPVLYSKEQSGRHSDDGAKQGSRPAPSSSAFVPCVAGILLAQAAVIHIAEEESII